MKTSVKEHKHIIDYISNSIGTPVRNDDLFFPNSEKRVGFVNEDVFEKFARNNLKGNELEKIFGTLNYKFSVPGENEKWNAYLMVYKTDDFLAKYGKDYEIVWKPLDLDLDDEDD